MREQRTTAGERRRQAVDAGLKAFGDKGLTTGAIAQVAHEVGVSPPYVFRLFGSKRGFFFACIDELEARELEVFAGDDADAAETFDEMGARFRSLLGDGVLSGFSIQVVAAARTDAEIADRYRRMLANILRVIQQRTSASAEELTAFLARGALLVQLQALSMDLTAMDSVGAVESLLDEGES